MTQKIVIAGSGFAGFWAAVSAMRAVALAGKEQSVEVTMVSPTPNVTIRPRLYEAVLENMSPDISAQLAAIGVRHLAGLVEQIDGENKTLVVRTPKGKNFSWRMTGWYWQPAANCSWPAVAGFAEQVLMSIRCKARNGWMPI
jgi:NADH:ubiquinone reductase (H+-translocating)